MRFARAICEVRQTSSLYWWEWFFIDCVRWCEQNRYAKGPQRMENNLVLPLLYISKQTRRKNIVISSIDIFNISMIIGHMGVFRYAIRIWQSSICGYLTTNYLRQIHLWRYYYDRRFRFCLLNVRLLFAWIQSRWKELANNITCNVRAAKQTVLLKWMLYHSSNPSFDMKHFAHKSNWYNNNLLDLSVQGNLTICESKCCK